MVQKRAEDSSEVKPPMVLVRAVAVVGSEGREQMQSQEGEVVRLLRRLRLQASQTAGEILFCIMKAADYARRVCE